MTNLADELERRLQLAKGHGPLSDSREVYIPSSWLPALLASLTGEGEPVEKPWDNPDASKECEQGHIYTGPICPECPFGEGEPVAWRWRWEGQSKWCYADHLPRPDADEADALYTRPVACPDREAVIACIRDAADRAFEAGRQGDIHFRFGDIIARADALLSGGGE